MALKKSRLVLGLALLLPVGAALLGYALRDTRPGAPNPVVAASEPDEPEAATPPPTLARPAAPSTTDAAGAAANAAPSEERAAAEDRSAAGAADAATFTSGVVVDVATDEPLPDYRLELIGGGAENAFAVTDAQGRFRLETQRSTAGLTARGIDRDDLLRDGPQGPYTSMRGALPAPVEVSNDGESLRVALASGPTYTLAFSGASPTPGEELVAALIPAEEPVGRGRASITVRGPVDFDPATLERMLVAMRPAHLAPVRFGAATWVRFPIVSQTLLGALDREREFPLELCVSNLDGTLRGVAPVATEVGRDPVPVTVPLERFGALRVRVLDEAGAPIRTPIDLSRNGEPARPFHGHDFSPEVGTFDYLFLRPGTWTVSTGDLTHAHVAENVELGPGERISIELRTRRLVPVGSIAGELRAPLVRSQPTVWLSLARAGGGQAAFAEATWSEIGDQWVGRFEFEDVPAGPHVLRCNNADETRSWSPEEQTVHAPDTGLLLLGTSRELAERPWRLTIVDAVSGAPVAPFDLTWSVAGRGSGWLQKQSGTASLPASPDDARVQWSVQAAGYATQSGDETAFTDGAEAREAEVHLRTGWGTRLVARGPDERPVAGVTVLLDGQEAGTTDAAGILDLWAPLAPRRVELRHVRLRLVGGDVDPGTGAVTRTFPLTEVLLGTR